MRRVALVTGGAKRIGRAIAGRLAQEGYELGLHYYSSRDAALVAQRELLALGAPAVHLLPADLGKPAGRSHLLSELLSRTGQLDLLVCSAAVFEYDHVRSSTPARMHQHLQTNFMAPLDLITAWAQLKAGAPGAQAGHAVVLLDQKLENLNPDYFSYTLSKLALGSSIRFLAQACAPWLRVNAVSPGVTMPSGEMDLAAFEDAAQIAALGRSSTPGDIADAVWLLETLRAATGQTLVVDGGQHLVPRRRDVAFPEMPIGGERLQ